MWKTGFLFFYLLCLSVFDGKEKRVPMILLIIGTAAACAVGIYGALRGRRGLECLLELIPGLCLLIVAWATKKAGYADGIVLAVVGAFEGFRGCMLIFSISLITLSVCCAVLLLLKRVQRNSILPYIPFLCTGYLLWKVMAL